MKIKRVYFEVKEALTVKKGYNASETDKPLNISIEKLITGISIKNNIHTSKLIFEVFFLIKVKRVKGNRTVVKSSFEAKESPRKKKARYKKQGREFLINKQENRAANISPKIAYSAAKQ